MKTVKTAAAGLLIGLCNALLGAGGGLLAVPFFRKNGCTQKSAQMLSLCVTLPLSALSAAVFLKRNYVTLSDAAPFVVPGVLGALSGTFVFQKSPDRVLHLAFALLLLWAGVRMLWRG